MTREEVPPLDSDQVWKLERRQIARQAEPGGVGGVVVEGVYFHQDRDCDFLGSQHLVIIRGAQQEALDFVIIVGNLRIRDL